VVPRPPEPPPPPPPVEPPPPAPDLLCPRCAAPHDLYQEYCLECGLRLPPPFPVRREVWTRESPVWLWAALLALLLVAAAAGAIVAVAATGDDEGSANQTTSQAATSAATIPIIPTGETITIAPPPTTTGIATLPTTSIATTTGVTTTTATGTTTTTTGLTTWPAGRDGFTIVLKSVPTSQGRGEADATAQTARTNGLPQVGVLNSSDFSSMNPGYYVAFSGIYDTEAQAVAALPNARSKGFPTAYIREVAD
jgi:hypothetical protein